MLEVLELALGLTSSAHHESVTDLRLLVQGGCHEAVAVARLVGFEDVGFARG